MDPTGGRRWIGAVVLVGAVYLVVGVGFAALGGPTASHQVRVAWRLAAWPVLTAVPAFLVAWAAAALALRQRRT